MANSTGALQAEMDLRGLLGQRRQCRARMKEHSESFCVACMAGRYCSQVEWRAALFLKLTSECKDAVHRLRIYRIEYSTSHPPKKSRKTLV